jgi:hypothetical protein
MGLVLNIISLPDSWHTAVVGIVLYPDPGLYSLHKEEMILVIFRTGYEKYCKIITYPDCKENRNF